MFYLIIQNLMTIALEVSVHKLWAHRYWLAANLRFLRGNGELGVKENPEEGYTIY